jgi:hypothetical protein
VILLVVEQRLVKVRRGVMPSRSSRSGNFSTKLVYGHGNLQGVVFGSSSKRKSEGNGKERGWQMSSVSGVDKPMVCSDHSGGCQR